MNTERTEVGEVVNVQRDNLEERVKLLERTVDAHGFHISIQNATTALKMGIDSRYDEETEDMIAGIQVSVAVLGVAVLGIVFALASRINDLEDVVNALKKSKMS